MNDVNALIRKAMFGDRWRSWVGAIFFFLLGLPMVGFSFTASSWNSNVMVMLVTGVLCIAFGAFFVWRLTRLPKMASRLGELFTSRPNEVAWMYVQEVIAGRYGKKVWNVFVWTASGEKMRLAVYTAEMRNALWSALTVAAPHAVAPYSKERERAMKSGARQQAALPMAVNRAA